MHGKLGRWREVLGAKCEDIGDVPIAPGPAAIHNRGGSSPSK